MKKIFAISLMLFSLVLSACVSSTSTPTGGMPSSNGGGEISTITKVAIGTLKLEGTENAITPEQASDLLPLWQVYLSLVDSDTAAQAEIDGLVDQISTTMTAAQNQAIDDMQLSQPDMMSVMQEMGISMGNRPQADSSQKSSDSGSFPSGGQGFAPPDGGGGMPGSGMPSGDMPSGGSVPNLSEDQIATAQASGGAPGMGSGVPTSLIEAVIEYLQKTASS
ncbi:MAG: hypothetical protein U0V18_10875 [Anaerolineales bacterium]